MNPVGYLTPPKSAKQRTEDELSEAVSRWVHNKYADPKKQKIRDQLASGPWTRELVVHQVNNPREPDLIRSNGVTVHRLSDVVAELLNSATLLKGTVRTDLVDLMKLASVQALV